MAFVIDPAFSLRNVSPGANIGETFRQRVNVSVGPVDAPNLAGEPIDGNMAALVKSQKIVSRRPACSAWLMPRKSGMRQTSQSRRTEGPSLARARTPASSDSAFSAAEVIRFARAA